MKSKRIPIKEAERIANQYGYEQVIILALKKHSKKKDWFQGWSTTFNVNKRRCTLLGMIARILAYNLRCFYSNEETTKDYFNQTIQEERLNAQT